MFVFCFFFLFLYFISFWFSGCWFSAAAALVLPVIRSSPWFTETVSCRSACAFTECEFRSVGLSRLCRDSPRFRCVRLWRSARLEARLVPLSRCGGERNRERERGRESRGVWRRRRASPRQGKARHAMPCHATRSLGQAQDNEHSNGARWRGAWRGGNQQRAGWRRKASAECSVRAVRVLGCAANTSTNELHDEQQQQQNGNESRKNAAYVKAQRYFKHFVFATTEAAVA